MFPVLSKVYHFQTAAIMTCSVWDHIWMVLLNHTAMLTCALLEVMFGWCSSAMQVCWRMLCLRSHFWWSSTNIRICCCMLCLKLCSDGPPEPYSYADTCPAWGHVQMILNHTIIYGYADMCSDWGHVWMVLLNHTAMLTGALRSCSDSPPQSYGYADTCSAWGQVQMVLLNHMAMLTCALRSCSDGPPQPYSYADMCSEVMFGWSSSTI